MASFVYDSLKTEYRNFLYPLAVVKVNGKDFSENKKNFGISDIEVEMTSGFEASIATFWIYGAYDKSQNRFRFEDMKSYILLGSSVVIYMGYGSQVREVFRGFIARVTFAFRENDIPGVEVTAMDIKGMMMSGNYSRQLLATSYSDAVNEILQQTAYVKMQASEIITKLEITATPDKNPAGGTSQGTTASDRTIEMVGESDYEFVVKAAKKFNYEFFAIGGVVYFRKAKDNPEILIETGPKLGLRSYQIEYDITGQVETIEVRGMDVGKSKQISASQKLQNKLSQGSKAKTLIKKSKKVYIDPTVSSQEEAGYRASYLAEDISYRFGTLEAEFIGLPELTPGRFIKVSGLGTGVDNTFYLTTVRHIMDGEEGYVTRVIGKAAGMQQEVAAGGLI